MPTRFATSQDVPALLERKTRFEEVEKIADTFNRQHALQRGVRVSKTYVANIVRANAYEVQRIRAHYKTRMPGEGVVNKVWGIDMTGKYDDSGKSHTILAAVDHGTRRLLKVLKSKASMQILLHLVNTVLRHGKPKFIRTDNERNLLSRTLHVPLGFLNIGHQRTDIACLWQNGRVERMFGTLKQHLDKVCVRDGAQLQRLLDEFAIWYNEIRPHQHLDGRTPHEVWHRIDYQRDRPQTMQWWTEWGGLLAGPRLRW